MMTVDRLRQLLAELPGQATIETQNVDMRGFLIEDRATGGIWHIRLPWDIQRMPIQELVVVREPQE